MAEVRARAPGKIILSGEHAVVHGSTAVAAAINLFTHVSFRLDPPVAPRTGDGSVGLELQDLGLALSWSTSRLKEGLGDAVPVPSTPVSCSPERIKLIAALLEERDIPEAKNLAFFRDFCLHPSLHLDPWAGKVVISSDLPLGSGLGSSASFCVALAASFLALSDAITIDKSQGGWLRLCEKELQLVKRSFTESPLALITPSGESIHIESSAPLRMLITNAKVGRNTKALVAGVSERASRHPDAMAAVFPAVNSVSKELSTIIRPPALDDISVTAREEKVEELMEMNQGLLQCMGVSHASSDNEV
ncbi:mevalonate kinase [Musa troglodytarum]|uniref:mevalonate kinase n=1 Tax=Musa troglodytarum TaxID=320322 RepID=A0A9E7GNC4_9LILI|nr:mevalonate kinase [Musa troglodytarum]